MFESQNRKWTLSVILEISGFDKGKTGILEPFITSYPASISPFPSSSFHVVVIFATQYPVKYRLCGSPLQNYAKIIFPFEFSAIIFLVKGFKLRRIYWPKGLWLWNNSSGYLYQHIIIIAWVENKCLKHQDKIYCTHFRYFFQTPIGVHHHSKSVTLFTEI